MINKSSMPKVVFLVLNYNGLRSLGNDLFMFIDSVFTVRYPNYEVVIVDNASSDGSYEELINRYGGDALIIRLNSNYGYAGGNELGFRKYVFMRGVPDYVVLINNDYKIRNPDFLIDIIREMDKDEKVVMAQGINLSYGKDVIASAGHFITNARGYPRGIGLRLNELPEVKSYISHPHGSCAIIKTRIIKYRPYIFIPHYFGYNEIAELGLYMWSHGFKSVFYPVVVGEHRSSSTFRSFSELRAYLRIRNELWMYREFSVDSLMLYLIPMFITHASTLMYRPLQGRRGALFTKAVIDGLRRKTLLTPGPMYPLIIVLKPFQSFVMSFPGAIRRKFLLKYVWGIEDDIAKLTITDDMLKSTNKPFLIRLS